MNTQELKDKILQMAIQGKLVKQDPNDEPATELRKRIKKEKEQLIKDKKIKKNKLFLPITDDEKPFNIPDNWEWVRLGEISVFVNGDRGKNYPSRNDMVETGIPFINAGHLLNGVVDFRNMNYITAEKYNKLNGGKVQPGDIIYCLRGTLGKCAINSELTIGSIASSLLLIRMISECDVRYIYSYLISGLGKQLINIHDNGTAQPNLSAESVKSYVLPLPPVIEQQRIVNKIDQLFTLIDTLEGNKEEMLTAIKETRNRILEEAIKGNLVKQDPNDEPAIELLKRIKLEKEQLIKDMKIKKTKELPPIEDEEKPFDVPYSWVWARFQDTFDVRDGTHDTPKYVEEGVPLITSKNLVNGDIDYNNVKLISEENHRKISNRSYVEDGDVLFAMIGSIGNAVAVKKIKEFSIKNVALFKFYIEEISLKRYLYYYLHYAEEKMKADSSGGVQSFVSLAFLRGYLIPLPPLEEQQRIVHKIDQIMAICDDLERQMT